MNINDDRTETRRSKARGHLINPLERLSQAEAAHQLRDAHDYLAARTRESLGMLSGDRPGWGCWAKRATIDLPVSDRPCLVGKASERIIEAINMIATLERLLAALRWFGEQPDMRDRLVIECHPSTSCAAAGNDLVLGSAHGAKRVLCEVTDVVSPSAEQNKKELRDLISLNCETCVPADGVRRFICTSSEHGEALSARGRKWDRRHYTYYPHYIGETMLLELMPSSGLTIPDSLAADVPSAGLPAAGIPAAG